MSDCAVQYEVKRAVVNDAANVTALALALWPEHEYDELHAEMLALLTSDDAAIFLSFDGARATGFAQVQLRRDYVEGTDTSPVAYLEGIYVVEEARRQGVARALLECAKQWGREKGCFEFASDCELDNAESLRFHLASGFQEANRIICFTMKL